jgi:ribonuclease P protein component
LSSVFTFQSDERLKSKKAIESLFRQGQTKVFFPLKIFVSPAPHNHPHPVKLLVSVPKKKIKSAVERNRVKRLLREAWRLNKINLYRDLNEKQLKGNVMLLYLDKVPSGFHALTEKMPAVFDFVAKALASYGDSTKKSH